MWRINSVITQKFSVIAMWSAGFIVIHRIIEYIIIVLSSLLILLLDPLFRVLAGPPRATAKLLNKRYKHPTPTQLLSNAFTTRCLRENH